MANEYAERDAEARMILEREKQRQRNGLELIASENLVSKEVLFMLGSDLTNKYAEGYPGRRYYGGCEFVDEMELLAIKRAKELFDAEHVNVQPHDGSGANRMMYYAAGLRPSRKKDSDRDVVVALGSNVHHLTHGMKASTTGEQFDFKHYSIDPDTLDINIDEARRLVQENRERTKVVLLGHSSYPRAISAKTYAALAQIAHDADAPFCVDMAHFAGLVAGKANDSPVPYADYWTTTTHKSLRGPRAGLAGCKQEFANKLDRSVFPKHQGGPHQHVIAGKAVCFGEALQPDFRKYAAQIIANTQALVEALAQNGVKALGGGEDANHLCLVKVTESIDGPGGKEVEDALGRARITVNKNMAPFEERDMRNPSCIRVGTPAVTSRNMGTDEMKQIGDMMAPIIKDPANTNLAERTADQVTELCSKFPVPADFTYRD